MSTATNPQQYAFQAEIKQLLHLLSHSLYQSREIAIRELVSNASDALDKMRFVAMTDEGHRETGPLEIRVEGRPDARELVIRDNGIGMTHDELVANLGTIARSGSLEFLKNATAQGKAEVSLIGQFGVGFYSSFMLADRVRVRSRSFRETAGWEWESDGSGTFTVVEVPGLERGTEIILHLKEDAKEFTEEYRIKSVLKTYSGFVPHPIRVGDQVVNDQKPIWVEPKSQVTEEQHTSFYQYLTHRSDETPLWHLHMAVDSPIQFRAILYCPRTNVERLGFGRLEHGLNLCAKRILVQGDCRELLPEYLRFLHGLVDSEDLPLNVSRETLQDNSVIRKIRNVLVKNVLDRLTLLSEEKPEEYLDFYRQFGATLKEGIAVDPANRDRVAKLLRFNYTRSEGGVEQTGLDDYLKRAPEDSKQIYFLGGPDLASLRKSPSLEIFRKRNLEVLLLTDPIDEFVMTSLHQFGGRTLTSIDSAELDLPETEPGKPEEDTNTSGDFGRLLDLFRAALGNRVESVRASKRLTDSPCCLVNIDGGISLQMQRLLKQNNRDFPISKRILEVNPDASLIKRLAMLSANAENEHFISQCALQLWSNTMILEGETSEPEEMVSRVQSLMEQAAQSKSTIII
ncbi:molecular chaperone HtpG [Tundrisphaera lichenicola]|uniref:molecular chaperone HtpG n=1 Tax=Tundrisphaera lichenicola TaxID=2029860 RepID=UPI003EBAB05E